MDTGPPAWTPWTAPKKLTVATFSLLLCQVTIVEKSRVDGDAQPGAAVARVAVACSARSAPTATVSRSGVTWMPVTSAATPCTSQALSPRVPVVAEAIVVSEAAWPRGPLAGRLAALLGDTGTWTEMAAARRLARPDAAARIVEDCEALMS